MQGYKPIPEFTQEAYNSFWSKVAFTAQPNLCWNWTSTIRDTKRPYGRFELKGETFSAHRVAYFLHNKVDPKELHALHKCDNPRCCNPAHIFLGTNADNVADKVSKGRQARVTGKRGPNPKTKFWGNHGCKATKEDFESMNELYLKGGVTVNDLVKKFGVCKKVISTWLRSNGIFVPSVYTTLTKEQVLEIRKDFIRRDDAKRIMGNSAFLCEKYGVGNKTLHDIINRVTWKQI